MAARKWVFANPYESQNRKEDLEKLFVFAYQCKLFRDDEKALEIDNKKTLIPWMGDPSLLIDRYDGRGHLYDLAKYDPDINPPKEPVLTEEEKHLEALCNEERYLELHTDLMEKALYEEEELKRLNEALCDDTYMAVGFNYDQQEYDPAQPTNDQNSVQEESEDEMDEEYVPAKELQVPKDMILPLTVKMNAIIEKTALFISKNGHQMEIMIKMKQKDNPLFNFMDIDGELNPFYKLVLAKIKSGQYKPVTAARKREDSVGAEDGHYLHPSLITSASEPAMTSQTFLNSIRAKLPEGQIANTPYAKLVSNIGRHRSRNSPDVTTLADSNKASVSATCSNYTADAPTSTISTEVPPMVPPPIPAAFLADAEQDQQKVYSFGPAPGPELPPIPGTEPVELPLIPHSQSSLPSSMHETNLEDAADSTQQDVTELEGSRIVPPPPDIQPIIDKMASYVVRNGPEFEIVVKEKKKKEERFGFLFPWHVHNQYYMYKKALYKKEADEEEKSVTPDDSGSEKGQSKGVSFSIKTKDSDGLALGSKRAVLYESSDEEGEESGHKPVKTDELSELLTQTNGDSLEKPQMTAEELLKRQAEDRLKDKLAAAAREKLAHAAKEKQMQAERKRKAAMFINMLKGGRGDNPSTTSQETTAELSLSNTSDMPVKDRKSSSPVPSSHSGGNSHAKSPTRSRSSPGRKRHRSRSPKHSRRRRSRSRTPRKKKRAKTPPSAYSVVRRSVSRSPIRKKSRSRSPGRKRTRRSRSKSLSRLKRSSRSRSKSKSNRKRSKSRERGKVSKSPDKKKSKKKDSDKHKSKDKNGRRRSRSKSKSKKRSRSRSRSKSLNKHKSRSKSPNKKSKRSAKRTFPVQTIKTYTRDTPIETIIDDDVVIVEDSSVIISSPFNIHSNNSQPLPTVEGTASPSSSIGSSKPSEDLLSKVRAMLKATREAELREDSLT